MKSRVHQGPLRRQRRRRVRGLIHQPRAQSSKAVLADGVAAGQGHDGLARREAAGAVRLGEDLVAARYFVRPLAAGRAGEGAFHLFGVVARRVLALAPDGGA